MYPRTITIENDKIGKLLIKKGELITTGRAVSEELEAIEKEMQEIDVTLQEEEKKVDITDILEKEKAITAKVTEAIKEMEEIKKEIFERMNKEVPKELHERYEELKKSKEEKESARKKIALKAQKYNDKIIPMARKMIQPLLTDTYEDYDSLYLEDGEVVATIFSHLNDFKTNFSKK